MSSIRCRRLPMAGLRVAEVRRMRAGRLSAIKADISEHLACPELTGGAVAGRQGITPRYVQRLFGLEGTTFSEFVLRQRLIQAHRMLGDGLHAGGSVTAIAFEAGFGDLSYFNRSFRRRYSASPSDVRKAALRGQPPFREPTSSVLDNSEFAPVQDGPTRALTVRGCGAECRAPLRESFLPRHGRRAETPNREE